MPRDDRTFITVHDGMPEHPKVEGLSDAAFRLVIEAWCWCSRNRTDGRIVEASWRKRGSARARAELIAARLVETTDDGVMMHDYTAHQRTAAEIDELRAKRRAAGSMGGKAKASATASASHGAEQTSSKNVPETETETDTKTSSSTAQRRGTRLPDDWKPNPDDVAWQRQSGISDLVARREVPKFSDYWHAKAGRDATKVNWSATWRNWLRNTIEREPTARAVPADQRRPGDFSHLRATTDW